MENLKNTISKISQDHATIPMGGFNAKLRKEIKFRQILSDYPAHK